jgi:GT2 family glycosyltransferase
MSYKIAAVVVTYNRLELLKQCIESLRNQTHNLDEIIIVNNSSTDGTLEWLNQQNDLTVITQENSGSAGGQYTGIKTAYEKGYDWIWCFDDDCFAESRSLEVLLNHNLDSKIVLNSVVLSNDRFVDGKMAFAIYDKSIDKLYRNLNEFEDDLIPSANFFNGTLLNRYIIQQVGLPLKKMFIRGEEYEYLLRIENARFNVYTVKNSKVFHPPAQKLIFDNKLFRYEYLVLDYIKRYYTIRNLTYITKKYSSQEYITLLKIISLDFIIMLLRLEFKLIVAELKGFVNGLLFKDDDSWQTE